MSFLSKLFGKKYLSIADSLKALNKKQSFKTKDFQSSNVKEIIYDPTTKTMKIGFHNGRIYEYKNVPSAIVKRFLTVKSKGSFVWKNVSGKYNDQRIKSFLSAKFKISDNMKNILLTELMGLKEDGKDIVAFPKFYDVTDEFYNHPWWGDPEHHKMMLVSLDKLKPTQRGVYIQNMINILNDKRSSEDYEQIEIGIDEDGMYILHGHHRLWLMKKLGIKSAFLYTLDIRGS